MLVLLEKLGSLGVMVRLRLDARNLSEDHKSSVEPFPVIRDPSITTYLHLYILIQRSLLLMSLFTNLATTS